MKTAVVLGVGNRGTMYARRLTAHGAKVVAIAEPVEARRNYARDNYGVPADMCFDTWERVLELPKLADVAVISTMDRDHIEPALAAIDKGYNLLLEKPMGATPEECYKIAKAAKEKGVFVLVCHVLRFTPFFRALKKIIDDGKIGQITNVIHQENVGNLHQSHSFVRGNWCNSQTTAPMILAKSCHDMDILQYLIGKPCSRVHSFGSLSYFKAENAPEGAPDFCIDGCPIQDTCHYYAPHVYLDIFKTTSEFSHAATQKSDPTEDDIKKALRDTNYGRCVFKCDNDVVDHQTVNLEFEGGETVSFNMSAFNKGGRKIQVMGTDGEAYANMDDETIRYFNYATRRHENLSVSEFVADETQDGGHGGGDEGIIIALLKWLDGDFSDKAVCTIDETYQNHLISFAAEKSRVEGTVIDLNEYKKELEARVDAEQ